jgi:hypothetical protein
MALRNLRGIKELRFILCQTSPASEGLRYYLYIKIEIILLTTIKQLDNHLLQLLSDKMKIVFH